MFERISSLHIETVINNAGVGSISNLLDDDLEHLEQLLNINVRAVFLLSMLFVREFGQRKNTQLINVASGSGYSIYQNCVAYSRGN